jgi:hypothetical protein
LVAFLDPTEADRLQKVAFPDEALPYVADQELEVHLAELGVELVADAYRVPVVLQDLLFG